MNRNCGVVNVADYVEEESFEGIDDGFSFSVEDNMEFKALGVGARVDCNISNWIAASSSGKAERE